MVWKCIEHGEQKSVKYTSKWNCICVTVKAYGYELFLIDTQLYLENIYKTSYLHDCPPRTALKFYVDDKSILWILRNAII